MSNRDGSAPRWTPEELRILATNHFEAAVQLLPRRTAISVKTKLSRLARQDPGWRAKYL